MNGGNMSSACVHQCSAAENTQHDVHVLAGEPLQWVMPGLFGEAGPAPEPLDLLVGLSSLGRASISDRVVFASVKFLQDT